jgi:hypothetical protein
MSPTEGVEELDGEVGEAEAGEGGELSIGESEVEGRLPRRGRPDGTILLQIGRRRPPPYWCAGPASAVKRSVHVGLGLGTARALPSRGREVEGVWVLELLELCRRVGGR